MASQAFSSEVAAGSREENAAPKDTARGFIVAAPHSGSGKTLVSLGLCRALADAGVTVAPAKSGPDYIDPQFLARAAGTDCINLDAWAMSERRLTALAGHHAAEADVLIVEGVMGLFDGALGGKGSTADLAAALDLPVVLVIDCSHMAQSVAAIAEGFVRFRDDVKIGGVILNRVASDKHETMLRQALADRDIACLGSIGRDAGLEVPGRHLGLVEPGDVAHVDTLIGKAAQAVNAGIDFEALNAVAAGVPMPGNAQRLPPLGHRIAIARDGAFSFLYPHWLRDWRKAGAEISFFSPLADEMPDPEADAVFLPGGYPELHAAKLAAARNFLTGMIAARDRRALIYGECGGYMVLGQTLTDAEGKTHNMLGLLPHATCIDAPRRSLGYRQLRHQGPLPFARNLRGHEFHYSSGGEPEGQQLFSAADAAGNRLRPMGTVLGRVCGSYAHVIDVSEGTA